MNEEEERDSDMEGFEEEEDRLDLSQPITLKDCYRNWTRDMYTGPRKCDLMIWKLAIQFDHDGAFERFKDLTLHDLLSVDFLQMWRYPNKSIMTMRLSQVIATLKGLEWACLSTVNPVMRTREWINHARTLLEALRARFFYFISHGPLSSRILDVEEDYTEEFQRQIDEDEEHDPERLDRVLGLEAEDYETDPAIIDEMRRKKLMSSRNIDWKALGMDPDREEEEEEEGDIWKKPLEWDENGVLIVPDESIESGSKKKAVPTMTTLQLIHDISWDFYVLDQAFKQEDKEGRIVVPDPNLTCIRRHLVAKAKTSWDSVIVARKQHQYNLQCTEAYTAKHRRRSQQDVCTSTEVLSSTMMAIIDTIEPLPADHVEMFKRKIGPVERENYNHLTVSLTRDYWHNRTLQLNSGWVRANTDFMFQTIGGMEIEKGDAIDYVLRSGKISRLPMTGKWVLHHRKKRYLCDSLVGAYRQMRVLQRAKGTDPVVVFLSPEMDLEMPATISLDQFDSWLF
jgi:hypothetical protein